MNKYQFSILSSPKFQERFWNKVIKQPSGCWEWNKIWNKWGYGSINFGGTTLYSHRVSWVLHNKQDWPVDLQARHLCSNPKCCNPNHIVPGTAKENSKDRIDEGTHPRGNIHVLTKLSEEASKELYLQYQVLPHGTKRDFLIDQSVKYNVSVSLLEKICQGKIRKYQHTS